MLVPQAGQGNLLEVILALQLAGRLAGRLHRRQQQGDQDADDHDHHQKLDKRKTGVFLLATHKL